MGGKYASRGKHTTRKNTDTFLFLGGLKPLFQGWGAVEPGFFDLIKEGLIANTQKLCCLFPIPPGLFQSLCNDFCLGFKGRFSTDLFEGE